MQWLFIGKWIPAVWIQAFCWTLLHSLWQGLIAAAIAGLIILLTKRSSARLRYNLLSALILTFLSAGIITFFVEISKQVPEQSNTSQQLIVSGSQQVNVIYEATTEASNIALITRIADWLNNNSGLLFTWWSIFFAFNCLRLLAGIGSVHRLRQYRTQDPGEVWKERAQLLAKKVGINKSIRLLQSGSVKVPVTVGFLKPVILVPLGLLTQLPVDQVEGILLHELAHIRRSDYLANIIQRFMEAIYFFNPAILWISSLVRQEREACCDDLVIVHTQQKISYLQALVAFQEMQLPVASNYAMSIGAKRNQLLHRVKRLLTRENKKLNIMEKIFLLSGIVILMAFNFIPAEKTVKEIAAPMPVITENKNVILTKILEKETDSPSPRAPQKKKIPKAATILNVVSEDTTKKKKPVSYSDLNFPSVSSTSNDDGKSRSEVITVTDQNGKKYTMSRLNDKITNLVVDGKEIPESEYGNHSELIKKIDQTRHDRHEQMKRSSEDRKTAMREHQRVIDEKQRDERKMTEKMRMEQSALTRKQSDEIRRVNDKYRKEMEKNRSNNEQLQRKQSEELRKVRESYQLDMQRVREKQQERLKEQRDDRKKKEVFLQKLNSTTKSDHKYELHESSKLYLSKQASSVQLKFAESLKISKESKPAPISIKPVLKSSAPSQAKPPYKASRLFI